MMLLSCLAPCSAFSFLAMHMRMYAAAAAPKISAIDALFLRTLYLDAIARDAELICYETNEPATQLVSQRPLWVGFSRAVQGGQRTSAQLPKIRDAGVTRVDNTIERAADANLLGSDQCD